MVPELVSPGIWRAGTRYVNWWILDAGDGITVVDCGLPGYRDDLAPTLVGMGRELADVRAVLLTHGHIDHVGTAAAFAESGASVYLHPLDTTLAADPRENRTDSGYLPYLLWPATLAFVGHCLRQGALRPHTMPATLPLGDGERLADVPGHPLVIHTPGHTDGSCVLEFPDHDAVFVGDLLCTASPVTGARARPQLQTRASNRDSEQAARSLRRLEGVEAKLVLPGHGGPWRGGVAAAVASARRVGCR